MRFRRALRQLIAILVTGFAASSAGAGMLTFVMSGTVGNSFDTLHAGDAFTLTYTVDTSIPGNLIFQSGPTTWVSFDNVTSATVTMGSWSASSLGLTRQFDDPAADSYEMFSSGAVAAPQVGGMDVSFFTLQIIDPTALMVPDAFTPISNLSPFGNNAGFAVVFANDVTAVAVGATIESIALAPEPGTLMLLIVGCAVLVRARLGTRRGPVLRRC